MFLVQLVSLLADFLWVKGNWVILVKSGANYNRGPNSRFLPSITVASTTSGTSTPLSSLPSLTFLPSWLTLTLTLSDQGGDSGTVTPIYPPPPPSTPLLPQIYPYNIDIQPTPWLTNMVDRSNKEPFTGDKDDTLDLRDFLKRVQRLWEHRTLTFFLHDIVAPCLPLFIKMYIARIGKYNSTWNHILHTCGSSHHAILPLDDVSSPRWVIASLFQGHRKPNMWLRYPESLLQDLVASHDYSPPLSQPQGLVEKPIANAGFHKDT